MKVESRDDGSVVLVMENDLEICRVIAALASNPVRFAFLIQELDRLIPTVPCQSALFEIGPPKEESIFPSNHAEWQLGREAGFRRDELVGGKSKDFLLGYEDGRIERYHHDSRFNSNEAAG